MSKPSEPDRMPSEPSEAPPVRARARGFVLFAYGFRPFFLGAGLYGALSVLVWLAHYFGFVDFVGPLPGLVWHGHEMLFGYAAAVLAGFLLTAVPSWTETAPLGGWPLALLFGLWLAGRIALLLGPVAPAIVAATVDAAFLAFLAFTLMPALARGQKKRNFFVVPILGLLVAANLLIHLGPLGIDGAGAALGLHLAIDTLALLITVIGGRVVPSFTSSALAARGRRAEVRRSAALDRAALVSMGVLILADLLFLHSVISGGVALLAALLQALRLSGWRSLSTLDQPILWVLHLAYAWLVLGLALKGVAAFAGAIPMSSSIHALTIGAIGTMTLALMTRASLGHTGRPLVAHPLVVLAYLLLSLSALIRIAMPLAAPGLYDLSVALSGLAWVASFALFAGVYWPILTRPRIDGLPG